MRIKGLSAKMTLCEFVLFKIHCKWRWIKFFIRVLAFQIYSIYRNTRR